MCRTRVSLCKNNLKHQCLLCTRSPHRNSLLRDKVNPLKQPLTRMSCFPLFLRWLQMFMSLRIVAFLLDELCDLCRLMSVTCLSWRLLYSARAHSDSASCSYRSRTRSLLAGVWSLLLDMFLQCCPVEFLKCLTVERITISSHISVRVFYLCKRNI